MTDRAWDTIPVSVQEAALQWHARLSAAPTDTSVDDRFTEWLSADPVHYDAYALIERFDAGLDGLARQHTPTASNDNNIGPIRWAAGLAAAVVLSVSGILGLQMLDNDPPAPILVAEAVDRLQTEPLPDGSTIALAPGSTATVLYRDNKRQVTDFQGLGYFDVASNPSQSFTIATSQGNSITVIGTQFEVDERSGLMAVSVAEGVVEVSSAKGGAAEVAAGSQAIQQADGSFVVQAMEGNVSNWRNGVLTFSGTPLQDVVGEINRFFNSDQVSVSEAAENLRFSGVLSLRDPEATAGQLAGSQRLTVRSAGDRLVIDVAEN